MRASVIVLLILAAGGGWAQPAAAQGKGKDIAKEIEESRRRLQRIRAERTRLQRDMRALQSRTRDISGELRNIEQRLSASRSVLAEIGFQADATGTRVRETTRELIQTRERLAEAKAVLHRRLRDIYKRGPLSSVKVLLGSGSFTDMLNRYRYLRMIAAYDRSLVDRIGELEGSLALQSDTLRSIMAELGRLRQFRLGEVAELRSIENERIGVLERFREQERRTVGRLEELDADEERLTGLIEELERLRLEEERRRASENRGGEEATLDDSAKGQLDWPVNGNILYRFGLHRQANGLQLRWHGIGIKASAGTAVKAVRSGTVALAGPFGGYGPTVIVSHGEGFYTLYLYLDEIEVVQGRRVETGQVVGTVGGGDTPEGPHLEFQIRVPGGAEEPPRAVDPLQWLRPRGGRKVP